MAAPVWFDRIEYLKGKAVQMGTDVTNVYAAFISAGFDPNSPDAMFMHFQLFGNAEGVSPNGLFDGAQYIYGKAATMYGKPAVTNQEAQSVMLAFTQNGFTAWDHYQWFWAEDYAVSKTFNNPSVKFDVAKYMNDKLALMQKTDANYTMDMLVKAFVDNGLNPVTHFYAAGKAEGLQANMVTSGMPGATYQLTAGDDGLFGTTGNDFFNAKIGTLGDNDYIDGGTGVDTMYAHLKVAENATDVIAPTIVNVENVILRGQLNTGTGAGDNITKAYFDAGNIQGMTLIGSDNSRASLQVEDVRTDSDKMTIRMSNTDAGEVSFGVYFDPQHLKATGAGNTGSLVLQLMDVKNADQIDQPLTEQPFDKFTFNYALSGNNINVTLTFRAADKALYTGATATYDTLLTAFQNAITDYEAANPSFKGIFSAELGANFSASSSVGGVPYNSDMGKEILIKSTGGAIDVKVPGTGWGVTSGTVPAVGGIVWGATEGGTTLCPLIQTSVQLDNVGRVQWEDASDCLPDDSIFGTQAGVLEIGSMAGRGGVERFDITVDKGSWLSEIRSTNETLRMITVKNGQVDGTNDKGNLFVGSSLAGAIGGPDDATDMESALWMNTPRLMQVGYDANSGDSLAGITDVKLFDASAMEGIVNIGVNISAKSFDKYLGAVDGSNPVDFTGKIAPSGNFQYLTGSNNDAINMLVDGGVAADRDFVLDIKTNAGNDLVNFAFDFNSGNQVIVQENLDNVNIELGAGNDTAWAWGMQNRGTFATDVTNVLDFNMIGFDGAAGSVKIDGGADNDAIYVAQDGAVNNAVWVLNADTSGNELPWGIRHDPVNGAQPLNNNVASTITELEVTNGTASTSHALNMVVSFLGVTRTVKIGDYVADSAGDYTVNTATINAALIKLINEDAVLSKLLVAKDGAGRSVLVESLIDGMYGTTDFTVTFNQIPAGGTASDPSLGYSNNQASDETSVYSFIFGVNTVVTTQAGSVEINGVTYSATPTASTLQGILSAFNTATVLGNAGYEAYIVSGGTTDATGVIGIRPTGTDAANKFFTADASGAGFGTISGETYTYDSVDGSDLYYAGYNTVLGGAGNDVLVTGYADALVQGGAGNDIIVGGNGHQTVGDNGPHITVAGGAGADHIYLGDNNLHATAKDVVMQAKGDSMVYVVPTGTVASVAGADVVYNFDLHDAGTSQGDLLNIAGYSTSATMTINTAAANSLAAADMEANNTLNFVRGTYNALTGTFSLDNAAGTDMLVVYDSDSTAGTQYESIILTGLSTTAAANSTGATYADGGVNIYFV